MQNKFYKIGFFILLFIIVIGLTIFFLFQRHKIKSQTDFILTQFKAQCVTTDKSPFQDKDLGFQFEFPDDVIVCDRKNFQPMNNDRDISLWKKSVFYSSNIKSDGFFGQGIIGGVRVNPPTDFPKEMASKQEGMIVAKRLVTVMTMEPPSCPDTTNTSCPEFRIAEFIENGNTYQLQEIGPNVGIFKSFTFLSSTQK